MALAFLADSNPVAGTGSVTPDAVTDVTPIEGDHAFITVSWKRAGATLATPTDWVLIYSATVGTGTPGAADGPIELRVYYRQVPSGGLTLPTLTMGGDSTGRVVQAGVVVYRGDLGTSSRLAYTATFGSDTSSDTSWSITGAADIGIETGDAVLVYGSCTVATGTTFTSPTLATTGVTYGSTGNPFSSSTTSGDDLRSWAHRAIATSGPSSAAPTFTATVGANTTGGAVFLRLREVETRRFYLANAAPSSVPTGALGFWDDDTTGLATPHLLAETPTGAGASTAVVTPATEADWYVLCGQWTSHPASAAGTISGLYSIAAAWLESNAAANLTPVVAVWVVSGIPINQANVGREFPTTAAGIEYTLTDTDPGSVEFDADDTITVEVGFRSMNSDGISRTGTLYYGGTGTPDMADGVTTLTRPGWIELQITPGIVFEETGTAVPLGRTGETSSVRAVTTSKQRQLGPASSTGGARAMASAKSSTIGRPAETDAARPLTASRAAELARPSESAGTRPLTAAKSTALGPAGTLAAARALTSERTFGLAAAGETDGVGLLVENRGLVAAAETTGTRALDTTKAYVLGRAGDTTGARALNTHELGRPFTLEGLRQWTVAKQAGLAPATDLGAHARQLLPGKTYVLGRAGEVDQARELTAAAYARQALTAALWAVDPADGDLVPLPHWTKLSVSPTRNSQGSISVEYPAHGRNAFLLRELADEDRDLEVEIWLTGSREHALRGLLSESSSDDTDEHAVNGYTGTLLEQLLDEVLLWPQEADEKKELAFTAANAGEMAATVLQQAQARGCLAGVTRDFTTSADSAGAAWATETTVKFSPTATFLDMLQELVDLGMIDAVELTADRVLRLFGPDSYGVDRTVGAAPLTFRRGRDLTQAPQRHSVRSAGTTVLAAGAEGHYQSASDATALTRRGRRIEIPATANALKDAAAVLAFAQNSLPGATTGTHEVAHGLAFGPGRPRPRVDFERGDWVRSDTNGRIERRRIWQWTVVADVQGHTGELVVGTPVTDRLLALARRLKRISSGAAVVGTSEPPPPEDTMAPAAPTGVVVDSSAFQEGGDTVAVLHVGWAPVTTNADGTATDDVAGYRIETTYVAEPDAWTLGTDEGSGTASSSSFGTFTPGVAVRVRVFAYDRNGNTSVASTTVEATLANDLTPPPAPSAPTVTSRLGVLLVSWDGLGSVGEAMPLDLDFVEVHVSAASLFTPDATTYYDRISPGGGTMPVTDQPYGEGRFVRLVAVDKTRPTPNRSPPSQQTSGVATKVVSDDIFAGAVGHLALASAAVRTINIDTAAVNDAQIGNVSAGKITTGVLSAAMTISGIIRTALSGRRMEIDSNGWRSYKADGTTLFAELNLATETMLMTGTYRSGLTGERIYIQSDGTQRIFGLTGTDYGQLVNDGGMWSGISRADGSGRRSRVDFAPDGLHIKYGTISQTGVVTQTRSQADFGLTYTVLNAPVTGIRVWSQFTPNDGTANRFHFVFANSSGDINDSVLHYMLNDELGDDPAILAPGFSPEGSGITWSNNRVTFTRGDGNATVPITAGAFDISSTELVKRDIAPLRLDEGVSSLDVVDRVPAFQWRYDWPVPAPRTVPLQRRQADGSMAIEHVQVEGEPTPPRMHYFPMAEHLQKVAPDLVHADQNGRLLVSVSDTLGLLWDAVQQLSAQVRGLRGETAPIVIDGAVLDPSRWAELPPKTNPRQAD